MSHPIPTNDYSDKHNQESRREYSHRRDTALGLNKTQRAMKRVLKEAGESFRKPGESAFSHLKRLTNSPARGKAINRKIGRKESTKERRDQIRGEEASDFARGN